MKIQSLVPWVLALVVLAQGLSIDTSDVTLLTSSGAAANNSTVKKAFSAVFNDPIYDMPLSPMSPERERSKLCIDLSERDEPAKTDYETIIGPWVEKSLEDWRAKTPGYESSEQLGFINYLTDRYAPDVTPHTKRCSLDGICTLPSCGDFSDEYDTKELVMAFWALESMFNMMSGYHDSLEANKEAFAAIQPSHFVSKYTDYANHKGHQTTVELKQKVALGIALTAALMIAGATQTTLQYGFGVADAAAGIAGTIASVVSGLHAGLNGIGSIAFTIKAGKPDEVKSQIEENMRQASKDRFQFTQDHLRGDMERLLKGDVGSTGSSIAGHVKSGRWHEKIIANTKFIELAKNIWFAAYLGMIWKMERVYIVMADAHGGCAADRRGLKDLKVCLDEYPNNVFYIYFIPRVREGTKHQALVRGPPGWYRLAKETGGNITLTDVVQSSVNSYMQYANSPPSRAKTEEDVKTQVSTIAKGSGMFNGFFHIPVCRNAGGEAISSVNSESGRNYPCMCGTVPWPKGSGYSESSDETHDFLDTTGLYQSGDWHKFCHRHMDCSEGKKGKVAFREFKGKPFHKIDNVFKYCKHPKGHGAPGCDSEKSDGTSQNKC